MASPGFGDSDHIWWGALSLLNILSAFFMGILFGFLAGLGVGGGTLLILWLTMVMGMDHTTARAINLMFFLVAAGSVTILRWRKGKLHIKKVLPAIISGCIAAGIVSWIGTKTDKDLMKKMFGIVLLYTGIKELLYRPRKAK